MLLTEPTAITTCFNNDYTPQDESTSFRQDENHHDALAAAAAVVAVEPRETCEVLNFPATTVVTPQQHRARDTTAATPNDDNVDDTPSHPPHLFRTGPEFVGACVANKEEEVVFVTPKKVMSSSAASTTVPSSLGSMLLQASQRDEVSSVPTAEQETPMKIQPLLQTPTSTKPLKSSLKKKGKSRNSAGSATRRVRGLWNERADSPVIQLHDDLLARIFQFNTCTELVRLSAVSQRFRHVVNSHKRVWEIVDATDALSDMSQYFEKQNAATAADQTSTTLTQLLEQHASAIRSLTIERIGSRLAATQFLPCLTNLQHLSLQQFDDLSDTAVHVWLLGTTTTATATTGRHRRNNNMLRLHQARPSMLRHLSLTDCPLLTNAAVRSIAHTCVQLETLSLAGCTQISNLETLLQHRLVEHEQLPKKELNSATGDINNDGDAKGDNQEKQRQRRPCTPPAQRQQQQPPSSGNNLAGLFAPPGTSPKRRSSNTIIAAPLLRRRSSSSGSVNLSMEMPLLHVDVSRTSVEQQQTQADDDCRDEQQQLQSDSTQPLASAVGGGGSLGSLFTPPPLRAPETTAASGPAGAGSLSGLFAPPPLAPKTTTTTTGSGAAGGSLTSLLAPPPVAPKTTITTASTTETATTARAAVAGDSLASLFAPPSPPSAPTTTTTATATAVRATAAGDSSLTSIFAPPQPASKIAAKAALGTDAGTLASLFAPPPTAPKTTARAAARASDGGPLASLFAPPLGGRS